MNKVHMCSRVSLKAHRTTTKTPSRNQKHTNFRIERILGYNTIRTINKSNTYAMDSLIVEKLGIDVLGAFCRVCEIVFVPYWT